MIGLIVDFETNGFRGSSVLSVAAIKIATNWNAGTIQKIETFVRHYYPVEKWNPRAQAVNSLSAEKICELRTEAGYPVHFRDDMDFSCFTSDVTFGVAHNVSFDSQFANLPIPWICTMKLAGGNLSKAATANGIVVDQDCFHQALYDAEVCLALFSKLLSKGKVPCPCR